jgi:hypothetical protein
MLAGSATIIFNSKKTGNQFAYHIKVADSGGTWFVSYLGTYIGFIRGDLFIVGKKHEYSAVEKKAIESFQQVWLRIVRKIPHEDLEIMHDGSCGYCGRPLTDAESIERGIGPICAGKMHLTSSGQSRKQSV